MSVLNYIILLIVFVSLTILYQKYLEKKSKTLYIDSYDEIRKYLLNESDLAKSKKPILWIHVPYEYNSRNWLSFGSRSSFDLNQPYLYITVKSIIKCCDESFNICIIDDSSFERLIPDWSINMSLISDPILTNMRQLGIAKLIYHYGGLNVPISFLCWKDLNELYIQGTRDNKMLVCENVDTNITTTNQLFYPDSRFIGANKNNEIVKEYINKLQQIISTDYTAQSQFLGTINYWCSEKIKKNQIILIAGTDVGTRTINNEPVLVDDLLSQEYIQFYEKAYGIWIPAENILNRRKYEWFARMSQEQILNSNFILGKYMLLTIAPHGKNSIIESFNEKPDWMRFWKVPISTTLPIYGPMPQNLGNNVPKFNLV
jgi:hypothetical protein